MEFYKLTDNESFCRISFNSQRDGILPLPIIGKFPILGVSIPNGMEFYARLWRRRDNGGLFQFPTGWNSTIGTNLNSLADVGFNSQRDGILLNHCLIVIDEAQFQFPTGWNSTNLEYDFYSIDSRFNSQRDGILRGAWGRVDASRTTFQFPTGWNSTAPARVL